MNFNAVGGGVSKTISKICYGFAPNSMQMQTRQCQLPGQKEYEWKSNKHNEQNKINWHTETENKNKMYPNANNVQISIVLVGRPTADWRLPIADCRGPRGAS